MVAFLIQDVFECRAAHQENLMKRFEIPAEMFSG
jgi:hypothetical protein